MNKIKDEFLPFYLGYWTEEMKSRAFSELGESDEIRENKIEELRFLLREDNDIVCRMDADFLLLFLRVKKFRIQDARMLVRNYYKYRKDYPELYGRPRYSRYFQNFVDHIFDVLPYRDKDGAAVVVFYLDKWNVEEQSFADIVHTAGTTAVTCATMDIATQLCGIKFIVDFRKAAFRHIKAVSIRHLLALVTGLRNRIPVRIRGVYVYGANPVIAYLWQIIKNATPEKIKTRIHFYTDDSQLLKQFDAALIPKELGGNLAYDNGFFMELKDMVDEVYTDGYFRIESYGYMK